MMLASGNRMHQAIHRGETTAERRRDALRALVAIAGILPWALALARVHGPAVVLSFHTLCHQLPERTISLLGAPMVVCSRCAGVYAGIFLGALLPLPRAWLRHGRRVVVCAAVPALIDVVTQDLGVHPSWHPARLVTGLALGWASSAFMFAMLAASARHRDVREGVAETGVEGG